MQRVRYREVEEMGEWTGHHVLWEGKYITQGCAASARCDSLAGEVPCNLPDVVCFSCPSPLCPASSCACRTSQRRTPPIRVAGAAPTAPTTPRITPRISP